MTATIDLASKCRDAWGDPPRRYHDGTPDHDIPPTKLERRKPRKVATPSTPSNVPTVVAAYRAYRDRPRGQAFKRPTVSMKLGTAERRGITWARGKGYALYQQLVESWLAGELPSFTVVDTSAIMFEGDTRVIEAGEAYTYAKQLAAA